MYQQNKSKEDLKAQTPPEASPTSDATVIPSKILHSSPLAPNPLQPPPPPPPLSTTSSLSLWPRNPRDQSHMSRTPLQHSSSSPQYHVSNFTTGFHNTRHLHLYVERRGDHEVIMLPTTTYLSLLFYYYRIRGRRREGKRMKER